MCPFCITAGTLYLASASAGSAGGLAAVAAGAMRRKKGRKGAPSAAGQHQTLFKQRWCNTLATLCTPTVSIQLQRKQAPPSLNVTSRSARM